ncbi:MAG: hypothetical protein ABIB71_06070 [Candidatus Woesearchaeota archaeon]
MEQGKKAMAVQFFIEGMNIQVQMHQKNVSPQEALGLLDMAKMQILDGLAKNRKDVFSANNREG